MSYAITQDLDFVYDKPAEIIYVRSRVKVTLPGPEETLDPQDAVMSGAYISKEYRAIPSDEADPNVYTDEFRVRIISNVATPQGETDTDYARQRISQDLVSKNAEFYTMHVTVYTGDGQQGGEKSKNISFDGDIEIL